jgi:uncharacterized membrane protein YgcG
MFWIILGIIAIVAIIRVSTIPPPRIFVRPSSPAPFRAVDPYFPGASLPSVSSSTVDDDDDSGVVGFVVGEIMTNEQDVDSSISQNDFTPAGGGGFGGGGFGGGGFGGGGSSQSWSDQAQDEISVPDSPTFDSSDS